MIHENYTFEEKNKLIVYLMRLYRKAKTNISYIEDCDLIQERIEEYRVERKTKLIIEDALDELDEQLRMVIINEYVLKKDKKWYLEYYGRSSYYRLKSKAIDEFLRCIHN